MSGTSVSVEDLQTLLSKQDPGEEEMSFLIHHLDWKYINCDYTIANLVVAVFAKSLHGDRKPDHVQGWIRARRGGEAQWYEGAGVSYLTCPEVFAGTVNFELVNQIQVPGRCLTQHPIFTFGQVVWKYRTLPASGGSKVEYDTEPYIVLTQCLTTYCYLLCPSSTCHSCHSVKVKVYYGQAVRAHSES